jgi:hypothetical protein
VSVNDVSRQIFEAQAEVERTLLHNRDVLLCGNHLYSILSVIVDPAEGVGIRTLSICGWSSKLKFKVRDS